MFDFRTNKEKLDWKSEKFKNNQPQPDIVLIKKYTLINFDMIIPISCVEKNKIDALSTTFFA